jgi:hypothetical protein
MIFRIGIMCHPMKLPHLNIRHRTGGGWAVGLWLWITPRLHFEKKRACSLEDLPRSEGPFAASF